MDTSILVSSQRNFSARDTTPSFCIGDRVQVEYTTEPPGFKHFIDDLKIVENQCQLIYFEEWCK